jgi:hypothetical protein
MTVNLLPAYSDPEEDLAGQRIYLGTSRFTILWGTNAWGWMGLASPRGLTLTAYFGSDEATDWVDGEVARADGLSRQGCTHRLGLAGYYKLRGQRPWLHFAPGSRVICTWFVDDYADVDAGVRAARSIDEYLGDGADHDTIGMMIGLADGFALRFVP